MTLTERDRLVGVILAGGLSRRMGGGDKGLLSLGTATMLGEVVRRISPQVGRLVRNGNGEPRRFDRLGLPVVEDTVPDFAGPLAGLLAGLRWAAREAPAATHILSVSSDAPFLPADLAERLAAALAADPSASIALAGSAGEVHFVVGLWPIAKADDLEAALLSGERKVRAWAGRHRVAVAEFPLRATPDGSVDPFFNANTPEDMDLARRLLPLLGP